MFSVTLRRDHQHAIANVIKEYYKDLKNRPTLESGHRR